MKLASYPWHVEQWLASQTRASLTFAERGLYRDLVDLCWYHGSLPADTELLRTLVGAKNEQNFAQILGKVLTEFCLAEDGRYHHPSIDRERAQRLARREQQREWGAKGGPYGAQGAEYGILGGRPKKTLPQGGLLTNSAAAAQGFSELGLRPSDDIQQYLPAEFIENEYGRKVANPEYEQVQKVLRGARERIAHAANPAAYARSVLLREGLLRKPGK